MCQCLLYLLINAKKFNLKCSITAISFYHSFVTSCSVTSDRNWPSGTQEEVFESVRTLHSRVLCLQIKRGGGVFVNSDQSASKYTCESVRISESWVHSTWNLAHSTSKHHYARASFSHYLLICKTLFCNSWQFPIAGCSGQTSADWLPSTYSSMTSRSLVLILKGGRFKDLEASNAKKA